VQSECSYLVMRACINIPCMRACMYFLTCSKPF
jgi:hypothetical protein